MFHTAPFKYGDSVKKGTERKRKYDDTDDDFSHPLPSGRDLLVASPVDEDLISELKVQWKALWRERFDDKVRAEGIANNDYSMLFVEKGLVIFATKDFKALNFREILTCHKLADVDRIVPPSPQVGGWGKFIRSVISSQRSSSRSRETRQRLENEKQRQQLKKGGRGWLHC